MPAHYHLGQMLGFIMRISKKPFPPARSHKPIDCRPQHIPIDPICIHNKPKGPKSHPKTPFHPSPKVPPKHYLYTLHSRFSQQSPSQLTAFERATCKTCRNTNCPRNYHPSPKPPLLDSLGSSLECEHHRQHLTRPLSRQINGHIPSCHLHTTFKHNMSTEESLTGFLGGAREAGGGAEGATGPLVG
jgi:hypothetical protein